MVRKWNLSYDDVWGWGLGKSLVSLQEISGMKFPKVTKEHECVLSVFLLQETDFLWRHKKENICHNVKIEQERKSLDLNIFSESGVPQRVRAYNLPHV